MNIYQEKIYNHLLKRITTGRLPRNERIPTENELGRMFGTNRMNAHLAVKELERFGVLRRNKRQGTFVHKIPTSITVGELKSVNTRRVCVLNHNTPQVSKIHWNERIVNTLKAEKNKIEMVFKDISHLNSQKELCDFIKKIAEDGYNSLIIVSDDFIDNIVSEHPEVFFKFHNNVFIFDRGTDHWHDWPYNVVSVNLFREGVIAAEYLLQSGYKKIIYAKRSENSYWQNERERGLQFGLLRGSDGKVQADIFKIADKLEGKIFDETEKSNEKCAIVASNDEIASHIFQKGTEQNLKAGIDFGLLGFDDNAKFLEFNLTTISPPLEKIGTKLAELVIKNLNSKKNGEISKICIDSELIIRKTC
jgi:DNA-binding LacI/PurR family transcriptional regulator/DNA-binding transcriptional regulator YhcF (GntR family)